MLVAGYILLSVAALILAGMALWAVGQFGRLIRDLCQEHEWGILMLFVFAFCAIGGIVCLATDAVQRVYQSTTRSQAEACNPF
jgi:hypothetical protein